MCEESVNRNFISETCAFIAGKCKEFDRSVTNTLLVNSEVSTLLSSKHFVYHSIRQHCFVSSGGTLFKFLPWYRMSWMMVFFFSYFYCTQISWWYPQRLSRPYQFISHWYSHLSTICNLHYWKPHWIKQFSIFWRDVLMLIQFACASCHYKLYRISEVKHI